jgi:hypothetical protein
VNEPVLTQRALNRALLARQLLLERSNFTLEAAIAQIGGLQTQYAPSGYVGLWTRLSAFERDALTRALEDRALIQATLMRGTIHIVSRAEFWLFAVGVRRSRREWATRLAGESTEDRFRASSERLRLALADGPRTVKELGDIASGFVGNLGLWVDLVRVPPSGTWERRRADRLALAEDWVGPCDVIEEEGMIHLVRAYLRAFGPAPWRDIASWAGISVAAARESGANLTLVRYRDADGRPVVDLPDGARPDPDTPAPIRFLPHWDSNLLVHARRTGLLPDADRPRIFSTRNPFSVGTYLVDGIVAGAWSVRDGQVVLDPIRPVTGREKDALEAERAALEAFHA